MNSQFAAAFCVGGLGDLYVCGAWAVELLEHQTGRGEKRKTHLTGWW